MKGLAVVFLLYCLSLAGSQLVSDIRIRVTPNSDQLVPFASDVNVTYTCTVDGGRSAVWEVRGRQILGAEQASNFAESGIFVEGLNSNTSVIVISGEARRDASRSVPPGVYLLCVALEKLKGTPGRMYSVITYNPPISPVRLTLEVSPAPHPTLFLVWTRPFNVDPRVDITYTVEINSTQDNGTNYGPFRNVSGTSYPIDFPEALHSNKSCQMYQFFVTATNGAGSSIPAKYLETLPITTDVTNVSQTLSAGSVDLRNGRGLAFSLSFKTLKSCSENFPIQNYTVRVGNLTSQFTIPSRSLSLPLPGSKVSLQLNNTVLLDLMTDVVYAVNVIVCSNFSCKASEPVTLYTTDLQRAEVIFYEHNIFLRCVLAINSPALGCSIRLSLGRDNDTQSDDIFELRRPTSGPENSDVTIISNCNISSNQRIAYDDIVGVDIESDGTLGMVELKVVDTVISSQENFTRLTECVRPVIGGGAVAIVLPIVLLVLVAVVVTISVVFVLVYYIQHRKFKSRPAIKTQNVDADTVMCEVKFKNAEITRLLKPSVPRSASAPGNAYVTTKSCRSPSSSSSQGDDVFNATDQAAAGGRGQRPAYVRSVSDNVQMSTYELELGERSLCLKLHRPGLRQYGKRSISEGGSATGASGEGGDYYPRVPSRLKISEELQRLLCTDDLQTVHEESEPTSPTDAADGETHSLIVPENGISSKKTDSPNMSPRSGITFSVNKDEVKGLS